MAPPNPPSYGSGPANYANQDPSNPFDGFNNQIRYNDMVRYQMVAQYQQQIAQPATMTLQQQRMIASQPRFQYGVMGGQDPRHYQRQAELNRAATIAGLAKGVSGTALWMGAEVGLKAVGAGAMASSALGGGTLGAIGSGAVGLLGPFALAAAGGYIINRGINESIERQRFMQSMSSDVEQYRDRLGFNGFTYQQASQLGYNLSRSMGKGGSFFSKEQQATIHKIALSNELISARGAGIGGGTIQQYERNFEELKDTTEEVVKLLQTTIEGGMSVIKELQGKGFTSIRQIRQQVLQAKAYGGLTGIGSQNMMQLGAAGAQAVQGTPWSAVAGAETYQMGAATASGIAASGPAGAYAVQRVGGVAAAGAAVGRFQMNLLQSGIGTKMAAYAMNADGSVNQKRLDALLSGNVTSYGVVTGANQTGYAMGQGGRVMFPHYKEQLLNNLKAADRVKMTQRAFDLWRRGKAGTIEQQAYAFAGNYTNDSREQYMAMQWLISNKGFARMNAAESAAAMSMGEVAGMAGPSTVIGQMISPFTNFTGDIIGGGVRGVGTVFEETAGAAGFLFGKAKGAIKSYFDMPTRLGTRAGALPAWGGSKRAGYGDYSTAVRRMYGFGVGGGEWGAAAIDAMGEKALSSVAATQAAGIDYKSILKSMNYDDTQYVMQRLMTSSLVGGDPWKDAKLLKLIPTGQRGKVAEMFQDNLIGVTAGFINAYQDRRSTAAKFDGVNDIFQKSLKGLSAAGKSYVRGAVKKAREDGVIPENAPGWVKDYIDVANAQEQTRDVFYGDILNVNIAEETKRATKIGSDFLIAETAGGLDRKLTTKQVQKFKELGYKVGGGLLTSFGQKHAERTRLRENIGRVLYKAGLIDIKTGKRVEGFEDKLSTISYNELKEKLKSETDIKLFRALDNQENMTLIDQSVELFNINSRIQAGRELQKRQGIFNRYIDYSLKSSDGKALTTIGRRAMKRSILLGPVAGALTEDDASELLKSEKDIQIYANMGGVSTEVVREHIREGTLYNYFNQKEVKGRALDPIVKLEAAYKRIDMLKAGPDQVVIEDGEGRIRTQKAIGGIGAVKAAVETAGGRVLEGKEKQAALEKAEADRDKFKHESLLGAIYAIAQGSGGAPAGVAPPVMNYFNNRWTA